MRNFETAARRGQPAVLNPVDIDFQIDGDDLTAHPPTSGQLALFMDSQGHAGVRMVQGVFDFLGCILDEEGVDLVREKLQEGVELGLITDIVQYLVEEWSARPTTPSSASSRSRASTGKRSTAKRPARAKTR